jgi:hypothetical protein
MPLVMIAALIPSLFPSPPVAHQGMRPPTASTATGRIRIGITMKPETATVGDPILVRVRVRAPRGAAITFPAGPDSAAGVEATEPRTLEQSADSAATDLTATYRLVAWDTGSVALGLGDILVTGTAPRPIPLPLTAAHLHVRSVLPPDTSLHVPKPARAILSTRGAWWPWVLLALILAALVALLVWWLWRRRTRRGAASPLDDPFEVAERDFARVHALGLLEAGERGRFIALAVEVLRTYLAARIPGAALSLTSTELLGALSSEPAVPATRLAALLQEADLVKFARRPLTTERAREIATGAREIVHAVHEAMSVPDVPARAA